MMLQMLSESHCVSGVVPFFNYYYYFLYPSPFCFFVSSFLPFFVFLPLYSFVSFFLNYFLNFRIFLFISLSEQVSEEKVCQTLTYSRTHMYTRTQMHTLPFWLLGCCFVRIIGCFTGSRCNPTSNLCLGETSASQLCDVTRCLAGLAEWSRIWNMSA